MSFVKRGCRVTYTCKRQRSSGPAGFVLEDVSSAGQDVWCFRGTHGWFFPRARPVVQARARGRGRPCRALGRAFPPRAGLSLPGVGRPRRPSRCPWLQKPERVCKGVSLAWGWPLPQTPGRVPGSQERCAGTCPTAVGLHHRWPDTESVGGGRSTEDGHLAAGAAPFQPPARTWSRGTGGMEVCRAGAAVWAAARAGDTCACTSVPTVTGAWSVQA